MGHLAVDFIEFFNEVVGDPALPIGAFGPYFIDQGVPRKNTVGHLTSPERPVTASRRLPIHGAEPPWCRPQMYALECAP